MHRAQSADSNRKTRSTHCNSHITSLHYHPSDTAARTSAHACIHMSSYTELCNLMWPDLSFVKWDQAASRLFRLVKECLHLVEDLHDLCKTRPAVADLPRQDTYRELTTINACQKLPKQILKGSLGHTTGTTLKPSSDRTHCFPQHVQGPCHLSDIHNNMAEGVACFTAHPLTAIETAQGQQPQMLSDMVGS